MSSQKEESRAYLGAIKIREAYAKELSPNDFLIENLPTTRARVLVHKEKLEGLVEFIMDPTLNEEVNHTLQEIRNYLLVVSGMVDMEKNNTKTWEVLAFLLSPKMPEGKLPPLSEERETRKILARLANFSPAAKTNLETCLTQCEEARENKPAPASKSNKSTGGLAGLMKKLGF